MGMEVEAEIETKETTVGAPPSHKRELVWFVGKGKVCLW